MAPLDVILVGSGVAGLAAAEALHGFQYRILEAAPHPGGRLVSPTWHDAGFDATAQFFTARSPELIKFVEQWLAKGWLKTWFVKPDEKGGEEATYAATSGMGKLMAHWAVQHNVSCGAAVLSIQRVKGSSGNWKVSIGRSVFGGPTELEARSLLLTAPWPVSQALLAPWLSALPETTRNRLANIQYAPCLVLEVETQGNLNVTSPGLHFMPTSEIACIADQGQKGLQPGLVMLMSPEFSEQHAGGNPDTWLPLLLDKAKPWLRDAKIKQATARYWPHARVAQTYGEPFFELVGTDAPLLVCGDGFGGPRMEGAFLSGWRAGTALAQVLRA